ncbi:hypothetical protein SLS62_007644 [Diatrype stigma]|uniref:Uncharacterized protein n=1 Tax=Diatrype stigma TaxID=117547 RepID=A0AAN9YQK6_9PEZI
MEAEERSEASQRDLAEKWQDAIRVKPESQRRWDVIKVVLRSLSLVCAIALILCYVALSKNHGFIFPWSAWAASLGSLVPAPYSSVQNEDIAISVAILGFDVALTGLHFTLFVRACMETERRNSEKQIRKAIVSLRQRGLHLTGFNLPGLDRPASTIEERAQESYELSPLAPDAPRHDAMRSDSEPAERLGGLPAVPDRALARPEAEADANAPIEDNMKFIIPPSIIREMTNQKYSMMGPANGEQKYPGIRRGER